MTFQQGLWYFSTQPIGPRFPHSPLSLFMYLILPIIVPGTLVLAVNIEFRLRWQITLLAIIRIIIESVLRCLSGLKVLPISMINFSSPKSFLILIICQLWYWKLFLTLVDLILEAMLIIFETLPCAYLWYKKICIPLLACLIVKSTIFNPPVDS